MPKEKKSNESENRFGINTEELLNTAKEKAEEAGKNVYKFVKDNSGKLKDAEEAAVKTIKKNPIASVFTTLAAGLALGFLFKKRK